MTLEQLIARQKEQIASKLAERNGHADKLAELRAAETTDEAQVAEVRGKKDALDHEIDALKDKLREYEAEAERDAAALRLSEDVQPSAARRSYDSVVRTGDTKEPRTYTEHSNTVRDGISFFGDAFAYRSGDREGAAAQRILRHAKEVEVHGEMTQRATSTGSFAGLVVPQYLIDMAALVLRNGRPIANVVARHQIPESGMAFTIPRGTTGVSTAVQATENSAVSSTDEVWSNLSVPVVTIAGQQDVSRQSLERGSGVDALIYTDLVRAYAANVDTQIISGSGSAGQVLGILNTAGIGAATAFGAAAGAANFNLKLAGALTSIYSAGQGLAADVLVVHPRRWGWLAGLVDSSNRPIVQANQAVAFNTIMQGGFGGEGLADSQTPFVGVSSQGVPVLLDLNLPTNVGTNSEDIVLALDSDELHLWEDGDGMPRQLSFEQTTGGSLTTKLVVYGYIAFTAGRYPAAVAKVGGLDTVAGQGLIAPTF
jgi:HK97 family phage major capsid protein